MPAASQDAAGRISAALVALSPGIVLLCFEGAASRLDMASLVLRPECIPAQPPLSWARLATAQGPMLLLLTRAQPCFAPGAGLEISDGSGQVLQVIVDNPSELDLLTEGLRPAAILDLLRFIASKATGILRHSEDSGLAECCRRVAETVMTPERSALPIALCGHDMVMWALPEGLASGDGVFYAISRRRLRRVPVTGNTVVLRDRQYEDGYLLPPSGDGPIHLSPPGGRLPSLSELGKRKDPESRAYYRNGLAELSRRAASDADARRQLRDLQLLAPMEKPHHLAQPSRPFGASLEMAICDHAGGTFFRGWIRDPLGLVAGLTLRSPHGEHPVPLTELVRFGRPDLAQKFAGSPYGGAGFRPGFALHLPDAALRPVAQWSMRLELTTGDGITLIAPPGIMHAQSARDAVLGSIAPSEISPALMERCIEPAVERLHAVVMAARGAPEEIHIGSPLAEPDVSIVVPLYRNLRFVKPQYASFARDRTLRRAELIYVLDSPEQCHEVEHLLRGLHGLYDMPVTLLVQPGNYGYASACNAGAAAARGSVLLMLNSDVIPAARGWLQPLLSVLARQPRLAAVGPKLLFEDGSLQHAGLFFERGPEGEWYNNHYYKGYPRYYPAAQEQRPVPGVTGAALCVRRDAYEAVGGFSTDYVIGDYEDSDLCLKLRVAGGEIAYVPRSELYHFERQSIRDHAGYARTLAAAYNRRLHHRRWASLIEQLMTRAERRAARGR